MRYLRPTWVISYVFEERNDDLTVSRAINFLSFILRSSEDTVIFANNKVQLYELGSHPELRDLPADRLKIAFCGGPPGKYTTYNGTLLSLLVDRVAWEIVHGNRRIFEQLRRVIGRSVVMMPENWFTYEVQTTDTSEVPCPAI